jgi:hypothetical protein
VYVCHSEGEWARQKSAFERGMVEGARLSRTATLLGFYTQPFPVCIKNGPPPKGHPANLTTVGSNGVNMGQHPCGTLSAPCRVQALMNLTCSEGKSGGVQLNIRKMSVMFCIDYTDPIE